MLLNTLKGVRLVKLKDAVYGDIEIKHPLVIKILESAPLQRLKAIDMAGYSTGFFPGTSHSRFEHSLGVYHLLSKHGARLEECIHGLLHDVSHTVFSHAVDYAVAGGSGEKQDFQDQVFQKFIRDTEIPALLRDFGLDPEFVFDEDNFPLQENSIPNLCADRLDYCFRGLYHYKVLPLTEIQELVGFLRNNQNQWFFETQEAAERFAKAFSNLDDTVYDSLTSAAMLNSVGSCLKYAMEKQILKTEDLFTTDKEVLSKISAYIDDDTQLNKLWKRMSGKTPYKNDPEDYEIVVRCKSRIVDPQFISADGILRKLSEVSQEWQAVVENGLKPKTYFLKFLD